MADLEVGKDQSKLNVPEEKRIGRDQFFLEWRHKLPIRHYPYCQDVDGVEFIFDDNNNRIFVAVVEHSIVEDEGGIRNPVGYFKTVDKKRKNQFEFTVDIAKRLGCPAFYLQIERPPSNKVWVKILTAKNPEWKDMPLDKWGYYLKKLKEKALAK